MPSVVTTGSMDFCTMRLCHSEQNSNARAALSACIRSDEADHRVECSTMDHTTSSILTGLHFLDAAGRGVHGELDLLSGRVLGADLI